MFGRPTFGVSQPSTFGFGNAPAAPFGQNQLFGNTAPGTYGAGTSTGYGTGTQPIFGTTQQSATPLFGTTPAPAFGQANQSGFGTSIFGNAPQPSGSGLFGTNQNTAFGQQAKPAGFGFSAGTGGGIFGQTPQAQQNTSVFQPSAGGGLFGSSGTFGTNTAQTGTVIKFAPVTGTDSMQKSGVAHPISTKHHCITCMKEYENKSLEELRWEDYQCNRKGPQQQPGFGTSQPFGQTPSTAPSLFGQTDNKPAFGQPSTGFGQTGFGLTPQSSAQNIFGKPATAFGSTTTTASTFGFGTNTSSSGAMFGANVAAKPFGTPAPQQIFGTGQPQQTAGFGTSNIFGQPNAQNAGGIFGKPAQPVGFNQASYMFGTPQQNQSTLFQTPKPNTGFNIFGQPNQGTTGFGQQQPSAFGGFNTFGKPAQNAFGQSSQPTFGIGMQPGGSLFGNTAAKPGSLFGATGTGNLFGNNNFQTNTGFSMPIQDQHLPQLQSLTLTAENQSQDIKNIFQLVDPFGFSPHLEGLAPVKPIDSTYATNPRELEKLLDIPQTITISPITKRMKVLPASNRKINIFEDAIDLDLTELVNFKPRTCAKRLVIKKDEESTSPKSSETSSPSQERQSTLSLSCPPTPIPPIPTANSRSKVSQDRMSEDYSASSVELSAKDKKPNIMIPLLHLIGVSSDSSDTFSSEHEDIIPLRSKPGSMNILASSPERNKSYTSSEIISPSMAEGDSPNKISEEEQKIDTCGVVLRRPEYYTIPELDKLIAHKSPDGACLIKGFTIGRVGYGSVSFPDVMNVANLNLDKLVHFRYRELTIYPDEKEKPPLGEGLNRRAQVTLDRVYPKSKSERKLITDVNALIAINFADTLRNLCEKHGTKFLDYRPDTGSWVFMVEHFSKYGFSDSDDEEANIKLTKLKQQKEAKKLKHKESKQKEIKQKEIRLSECEEKSSSQSLERNDDTITSDMDFNSEIKGGLGGIYDPFTIGQNVEDIDIECPSPLGTPPLEILSSNLHQVTSRKSLYHTDGLTFQTMKETLFAEEAMPKIRNCVYSNLKAIKIHDRLIKNCIPTVQSAKKQPTKKKDSKKSGVFSLLNKTCNIPLDKSLFNCRNYVDVGVFKSRSFKIGWYKGLKLATTAAPIKNEKSLNETEHDNWMATVALLDVSQLTKFEPFADSIQQHLNIVNKTSEVDMMVNGSPLFSWVLGKSALVRHQFLASETSDDNLKNTDLRYYKEIWDLCMALWGPESKLKTRRDLFSEWLKSITKKPVVEDLAHHVSTNIDTVFQRIYIYLTGNQVYEAADLAMKSNMPNLSLIISQLNLTECTKVYMQDQVEQWTTSLAFECLSAITQKVYMTIAGKAVSSGSAESDENFINICEILDWRRALAMHFWYVSSNSESVITAVKLYQEAFTKYGYAAFPSPRHINSKKFDIFDIQYHIMLLYINNNAHLEEMLNPDTHTDYLGDYRLSWLLMQTFYALEIGVISDKSKRYITTSFAAQLENMGLYKWAVFVLLFIKESNVKKNLVMGVVDRNLKPDFVDLDIEHEMVENFCVPSEWIHQIKSDKTKLLLRHIEAYKHLAYCQKWHESHEIAIRYVVPRLIICEDYILLRKVLEFIEKGQKHIILWRNQGGVILDYLKYFAIFKDRKNLLIQDPLKIHSGLVDLCTKLMSFPTDSPELVVCVSEISKRCMVYLKITLHYMNPVYCGAFDLTSTQLEQMIMPPDFKMDEIFKDISIYLIEE